MGKGGADASARFCLHCGLHKKYTRRNQYTRRMESVSRYIPGRQIRVGGVVWVVFYGCHEFTVAARQECRPPPGTILGDTVIVFENAYEPFCEGCRDRFQRLGEESETRGFNWGFHVV
ncbi:hypothetical protein PG984_015205 [Apiospora sp. TS-2023a]